MKTAVRHNFMVTSLRKHPFIEPKGAVSRLLCDVSLRLKMGRVRENSRGREDGSP